MEDAGTKGYGGLCNFHILEGKVPVKVKLSELLRNLTSAESQLCFEASKDLIKFLKSESGPELLRLYIEKSPKCVELSQVWETRKGSLGFPNILNLIAAVLSHPFGRLENNAQLDKFARWIVDEKMGDLLKELNSKDVKRQNATLSLLSAIVKRGSWLAGKVAKDFDFKIPFFRNAAKWKPRKVRDGKKKQPSTRKAFVKFAMSFLEVGNPRLLRGVLQQKDMYSGVLRGLGNDEDKTVVLVLSVLRDRVLVPESLVPPGLRSVLFGSVTLEQLVNISGREDGGETAELAHTVLLMVCTDPLNGLMPDPERVPSPLTGNPRRLLDVMKKLRATETEYHMNLLLAIVKGKPSLGSAYLDAFPYNTDDPASPNWFGIISLAADLISSVHDGCSFGFIINALQHGPKSIENSDIRSILKCICPCPFTRLIINKGLLHSDTLVKHGTLKLVLESLRFFDSLIDALDHISSSDIQMMHLCASLKLDLVNEVRISLPDPQVLFSLLSSLNDYHRILESHVKRVAVSKLSFGDNTSSRKKLKTDKKLNDDIDIIVSGISVSDGDTDMLDCDERILNDDDPVQRKTESHYPKLIREPWPENSCSSKDTVEDSETIFYTKLLDVLKLYYRTMSDMLEGSFDFSKLLPSNPLALPVILQHSLLSLITESIGLSSTSEPATRAQTQLYKHLLPLLNLLIYSPERSIKDQAYSLAKAAMLSTGAFDNNPREVCAWLMFIPGYGDGCTIAVDMKLKVFRKLSSGILSFLCDAVSTAGNHIFKYMDLLRSYIRKCQDGKDVSVTFSCFSICILEKCLRLLCSESRSSSLPDKSMISLYVSNTLKYILQTQVDARMLSSLLSLLLSERLKESFDIAGDSNSLCAWVPLKNLFQFSSSILQPPTCNNSSTIVDVGHLESSFTRLLHEVRSVCDMESDEILAAMGIGLSNSIICTQQADLLQNFPLTISVSNKMLGVPFPHLMFIFFLEPNFLIDVSKVWPEMFHAGLESAIAGLSEGRERTEEFGGIDSVELASASFSLFLRHAPFYMLFPVIPSIYRFGLSDQQGLQNLILASLSDTTPDYIISSFQYVLFCLKEAHRSYRVEPRDELEKLCEWCFTIMDHMLRKLFHTKIDTSSKSTRCLLPTKCVQELIETIFSHPALTAAIECPLPCNADCTDIRDSMDSFFESNKWKMIHIMDLHAINFMRTASELFMDFGFDQSSSSVAFHARRVTLAFKKVVQKIIFTFRGSIHKCLEDKDLTPFFQKVCALHTLKQFISPFELLECVNWMFSRIDLEDSSFHLSFRDSFLCVALQMACSVFCSLSACLRQPHSERSSFDVRCDMHEKEFDVLLLEKILLHVFKIVTHLHLDAANMCLLQAFKIVKECGGMQNSSFSLVMAISRLMSNVPVDMLSYCMFEVTKRKAELLFLITQTSPVHLSIFGHLLSDMIGKHVHLKTNATRETSNISDPELLMLLPTVFLYLDSVLIKAGSHVLYFETIASFYWRILLHVFFKWKCYVTRDMFDMECCDKQCLSMEEFFDIFSSSLLSTSVLMVQFCLALTGDLVKFEERLELFDSVCPQKSTCIDFLDFDPSQVSICSLEQSLNLVNRTVAKIELCRTLLFPEHNKFSSWLSEYGLETPTKFQSNVDSSRICFLRTLVSSWQKIVRKVPRTTDESCPMAVEQCSVFRFLEDLILRNVVELCKEMQSCLLKLDSLQFIEKFAKMAILHRFDDPTTLQKLRNIISFLSEGKFSCDSIIKLMVNDSRFEPAIRSSNLSSGSSQLGLTFAPLPSLMRSFVTPCIDNNSNDKKGNLQVFQQHSHQLELIKLLRELFQVKSLQVDIESAEGIGINLRDLVYLLLSSYSATVCESDLEIYNLLNKIVSVSDNCAQGIAEWDYLWGNAVIQLRKERELTQSVSCNLSDAEGVDECCKIQFRENLPIDPRMCAHTVLYFPHWRADGPGIVNNAQKDIPDSMQEVCSVEVKNRHIYDPIFILRFSFHCLSMGYIEPAEFANLGLLAVSFASISSRDDGTRKLGYAVLEKFKDVLEKCQKKRDVTRLQLLLSYLQNCLEEDWQKIASVTAIFIAEASFVILDRSHDRYSTITKQLMRSPSASFKGIPLFQDSFWSNSVNFRTDRLWILRLLYSGLNTDDDVHIYIRNSIFETLLSFYMSPLADNETKELIMQIVKKSTKLSKMVRHLIEHCGLISWLSSVVTSFCGIQYCEKKGFLSTHLALVLEVVNEIIFFRHAFEWLQKYALEQLSELSCHLCRILVEGAEMLKKQYSLTKLILQILTSTWKISQKRKVFQPHFTVSIEGLFNLCEAIDVCCKGCYNSPIARIGLEAVLMSAPPVAIIQADQEKVLKFVKWAISIALQLEETGGTHDLGSYRCSLNVFSEKDKENSLMSKLLRWLTASVILGKISYNLIKLESLERSKLINLQSLLEWNGKTYCDSNKDFACQEITLAAAIFYMQQLLGSNYKLLPSVVSALCLLQHPTSAGSEVLICSAAHVTDLCTKIRCPAEANSAWRWAFYQPWKDHSSKLSDTEKIEEMHACQLLLLVFSKMLAGNTLDSGFILINDVEKLGVFEWEQSILCIQ
ncbi:unnamed protein product [Cuscuta europaea]|uniref:Nucleolar pre-ribosomal-associated protein 1 N-terminal domain-containing protein n=1 Tax=Cuscuta europaea TaxID=41803 RepID=A0A9P0YVS0_CUSEU|nr:unnamed protein product [Cuscuta europaea]